MTALQVTDKKNTQNLLNILSILVSVMFAMILGLGWKMYDKLDDASEKVVAMEVKLDLVITGKLVIPNQAGSLPEETPPGKPRENWLAILHNKTSHEQKTNPGKRPNRSRAH